MTFMPKIGDSMKLGPNGEKWFVWSVERVGTTGDYHVAVVPDTLANRRELEAKVATV